MLVETTTVTRLPNAGSVRNIEFTGSLPHDPSSPSVPKITRRLGNSNPRYLLRQSIGFFSNKDKEEQLKRLKEEQAAREQEVKKKVSNGTKESTEVGRRKAAESAKKADEEAEKTKDKIKKIEEPEEKKEKKK